VAYAAVALVGGLAGQLRIASLPPQGVLLPWRLGGLEQQRYNLTTGQLQHVWVSVRDPELYGCGDVGGTPGDCLPVEGGLGEALFVAGGWDGEVEHAGLTAGYGIRVGFEAVPELPGEINVVHLEFTVAAKLAERVR
jgi:hypothetical protein